MTIYYVRGDGSDGNTGTANTAGGAWLTARKGSRSLSPGDTLRFVHTSGGATTEYVEAAGPAIDWQTNTSGGFGTSWSNSIRIEANPGHEGKIVLKRDTAAGSAVVDMRAFSAAANVQFVEFYNLIFDGVKNSTSTNTFVPVYINAAPRTDNTVHDIRFYGCECRHSGQSSGFLQESTTTPGAGIPYNLLFTKDTTSGRWGKLTDNGTSTLQHGCYMQGRDNEVSYTEVSGSAGLGVQIHRDSSGADNCKNIYLHHLKVHDNAQTGIYYGRGDGGRIHNCLAYDNLTHGIRADDGASNCEMLNCTSIRNTTANFTTAATAAVTGTVMKNCVARKLGVSASNLGDNGSTITITTCTNVAIADTDATDPLFVNAAIDDFHLQSGSPCRDTGTNLSASGITDDLDSVARGALYDQGAYEFAGVGSITYDIHATRDTQ